MHIDDQKKNELKELFADNISFDDSLSGFTSMGVGGPAEALLIPSETDEIIKAVRWCSSNRIKWCILGGGTNIVIKDKGINGLVIAITKKLGGFTHENIEGASRIRIMAGTPLSKVCAWAAERGLKGLEFAAGIPGTFGGAVKMNAGTSSGWISDVLESITVITADGEKRCLSGSEIESSYRKLRLQNVTGPGDICGSIIVEASIILKNGSADEIKAKIKKSMEERKAKQPLGYKNAGCIFRNPENNLPAGKLIEMAGLKGVESGGAKVSELHANFIVNTGEASAADIIALIDMVKTTVNEKFSVTLEPEVIVAG